MGQKSNIAGVYIKVGCSAGISHQLIHCETNIEEKRLKHINVQILLYQTINFQKFITIQWGVTISTWSLAHNILL